MRVAALVLAIGLVPLAAGAALIEHESHRQQLAVLDSALTNVADAEGAALEAYFERARAVDLVMSTNPSFRVFHRGPDPPRVLTAANARVAAGANAALRYLEKLYPESIGEACLIDSGGRELARVVRGEVAPPADLSPDESGATFFAPSFAQPVGRVHQSAPYVSPDTDEWVISNATQVAGLPAGSRAIAHFEVTIESFRRAAAGVGNGKFDIAVVDARTGRVVLDSRQPQRVGAPLGWPVALHTH